MPTPCTEVWAVFEKDSVRQLTQVLAYNEFYAATCYGTFDLRTQEYVADRNVKLIFTGTRKEASELLPYNT